MSTLAEVCTIHCSYSESIGVAEQAIHHRAEDLFRGLLQYDQRRPTRVSCLTSIGIDGRTRMAANAMLAAARTAAVPEALASNRSILEDRIAECMRRDIPISAQMLWSPKKHWVVGADSDVDIAELTALNTLVNVHHDVRAIHRPGLTFTFHLEDVEFEFMEGLGCELKDARSRYINGLEGIVRALGLEDVFAFVKMSDSADGEEERCAWLAQMEENYRALESYWYESEKNGIAGCESYPSYHALRRLGWRGSIPEEMRDHYLRRLTAVKERPRAEKVSMILRNFAGILLHHQKNLLTTGSEVPPIKFSFIPPAPGAPAELLGGRIDLRFVSRNICSRVGAAGPWSIKGYFRQRGDLITPRFASWHEQVEPHSRLIAGYLTLGRNDREVAVRADVLVGS